MQLGQNCKENKTKYKITITQDKYCYRFQTRRNPIIYFSYVQQYYKNISQSFRFLYNVFLPRQTILLLIEINKYKRIGINSLVNIWF